MFSLEGNLTFINIDQTYLKKCMIQALRYITNQKGMKINHIFVAIDREKDVDLLFIVLNWNLEV